MLHYIANESNFFDIPTKRTLIVTLLVSLFLDFFLPSQEQLGYIVMSGIRRVSGVQGFVVLVQSEKHPVYVNSRVEEFLQNIYVSTMLECHLVARLQMNNLGTFYC